MSIYKSDIYEYVKESILSILNQSYNSVDLYIQVDGDINNNVKDLLDEYSFKSNVYIFFNKLNLGLAKRLNDSIDIIVNKGGMTLLQEWTLMIYLAITVLMYRLNFY
nr:hypothetical protein [Photobacterium leiognathi]